MLWSLIIPLPVNSLSRKDSKIPAMAFPETLVMTLTYAHFLKLCAKSLGHIPKLLSPETSENLLAPKPKTGIH